jgi:GTP cyclohydrolase I
MTPPLTARIARIPSATVEDVQSRPDTRELPINRVGVKDISHPVRVKDRSAGEQHTIATFNMYVSLPHDFKGTHMSRFVEILHAEREISVESFRGMLRSMTERLEADTGHIEMSFPFFVMKRAPVSGVESLMDYRASLIGEYHRGETRLWVRVSVPVTSLCPCSKRIADYGAHNQRSHVTITARLRSHMWIEELIEIMKTITAFRALAAAAALLALGSVPAAEPPAAPSATPVKHLSLKVCNKQADAKKLTGPERAQFVKDCRSGKSGH